MTNDGATVRIGLVSVSDRAAGGVYQDQGIPALTRLAEGSADHSVRRSKPG